MFAGMVWGMVLSVFIYRSYFTWRDQQMGRRTKACLRKIP